jgi:hypothetical protein
VRSGDDLDAFHLRAVPGDQAVVVRVGADQVGQHLGDGGIGLGAADMVPVPVPRGGLGVDRVDLVPSRYQGVDPQARVGLDPDAPRGRVLGMGTEQGRAGP